MPRDTVSRTANVGTVGKNGLRSLTGHIIICPVWRRYIFIGYPLGTMLLNPSVQYCCDVQEVSGRNLFGPNRPEGPRLSYACMHAEKSFRKLIKSNRNQIVFTTFRLIWNQTDTVRLVPKQSESGKYNLISV